MIVVEPVEEPIEERVEAKVRSRRTLLGVTAGVVVAGALVAYGFSRSDGKHDPTSDTPPTIAVIQAPAQVVTTQNDVVVPGSSPATDDVPTVPTGTADVAFPPVSSGLLVP